MQLDPDDYLERFDRMNLCPREWDLLEARGRAALLLVDARARGAPVVLLGAKVTRACGSAFEPFTVLSGTDLVPTRAVLPHPSGLARAWGVPGAYERARAVLRAAGVLREAGVLPPASYAALRRRASYLRGPTNGRSPKPETGARRGRHSRVKARNGSPSVGGGPPARPRGRVQRYP